ncbi:MAG: dihydroneopterin aldolase, partial [Flavobacteriales bacterium]|nr:dihydroneopterin aldolase [Flavobacteriales bacterium]
EKTDDLNHTVDYVKIIEIVKQQMAIRSNMIEHPAKRIVDAILPLNKVQKVTVEVEKIQPPIDATFDKISVTTEGSN